MGTDEYFPAKYVIELRETLFLNWQLLKKQYQELTLLGTSYLSA